MFWKHILRYVGKDNFQNMIDKTFKTNSDLLTLQCFCNIPESNVVMHKIRKWSIRLCHSATTGGGWYNLTLPFLILQFFSAFNLLNPLKTTLNYLFLRTNFIPLCKSSVKVSKSMSVFSRAENVLFPAKEYHLRLDSKDGHTNISKVYCPTKIIR